MIQKGIIAQVIDKYTYKIRIPKYDKIESATSSTKVDDLSSGIVCAMPGIDVTYVLGDIVLVSFENDELSKPIILGLLYREQKSDSDISLSNVDNSLSDIQNNLNKINSSNLYTHIKYSNDNGITFTSLFSKSNHETIIDGEVVCQPLFDDSDINGIEIDKDTRVISWSIIDSNGQDVTDSVGIETTAFDSDGNTIKKERNTEKQRFVTINNSSQISGKLYLTYKLFISNEYLDTLSIMLTTDKAPYGVPTGEYVGINVSNDSRPSINTSDYMWFQASAGAEINSEINKKIAALSSEFNAKLDNLKEELDENFVIIYYKEVEWTQAEVDVYCQTGYEGTWSRDFVHGYTNEVKAGNLLYITVHNTGSTSSTEDDSYGRLEIRATEDAVAGAPVQGIVTSYLVSGEVGIDALARFKSSLLADGDETLIYGGHIETGTIATRHIQGTVIDAVNNSTETSGGTALTIAANKVNIEGAAIFTSGRLSQTSLDNAYDANGSAAAARAVADTKVKDSQRIYYRCKVNGTVPKPTTWITATTNIYNDTVSVGNAGWTTKVPPLAANTNENTTKYPYLYSCIQTRTSSTATPTCTDVLLDENTTVIDGGSIITNSITANQIQTGTITVGSLFDGSNYSTTTQMDTAIGTAVDEIEIGGRNFLQNTDFIGWTNCGSGTAGTFNNDVFTYPTTTADGWTEIRPNKNVKYDLVRNKTVTLSAEVKATSGSVISVMVDPYVSTTVTGDRAKFTNVHLTPSGGGTSAATTIADGTWQKVYATVDITDAFFTSSGTVDFESCYFGARCARMNTNHVSYQLRHVQIELGNKATDWKPAPEDAMAYTDTQINNIEIGGRNLLLNTSKSAVFQKAITAGSFATLDAYAMVTDYSSLDLVVDDYVTISFDWSITGVPSGTVTAKVGTNVTPWEYFGIVNTYSAGSSSGHTEKSYKITSALASCTGTQLRFRIDSSVAVTAGDMVLTITNAKLEKGNKATDWTPASEDIAVTNYITADSSGIHVHKTGTSNTDYIEINSSEMNMYSNSKKKIGINSSGVIDVYGGNGTYPLIEVAASAGSSSGVTVAADSNNDVKINTNGMTVRQNGSNVAFFGDTARIGPAENANKVEIKGDRMSMTAFTGTKAFDIVIPADGATSENLISRQAYTYLYDYNNSVSEQITATSTSYVQSATKTITDGTLNTTIANDIEIDETFYIRFQVNTSPFITLEDYMTGSVDGTTDISFEFTKKASGTYTKTVDTHIYWLKGGDMTKAYQIDYSIQCTYNAATNKFSFYIKAKKNTSGSKQFSISCIIYEIMFKTITLNSRSYINGDTFINSYEKDGEPQPTFTDTFIYGGDIYVYLDYETYGLDKDIYGLVDDLDWTEDVIVPVSFESV